MELNLGTAPLSDDAVLKAFEACQLDPGKFHHDDHIRLAWLCVQRYGAREAEEKLLDGLRRFAQRAGVPEKFMHTTTIAWARLVAVGTLPHGGEEDIGQHIFGVGKSGQAPVEVAEHHVRMLLVERVHLGGSVASLAVDCRAVAHAAHLARQCGGWDL